MDSLDRARKPARLLEPVIDGAAWRPEDLDATNDGVFHWTEHELAEIDSAVIAYEATGGALIDITSDNFPLPACSGILGDIRHELKDGVGFTLIHGLDIGRYDRRRQAIAYLGIGSHIGIPRSQNKNGHNLGHVKDLGYDYDDPQFRAYHTNNELTFHSDSCNVVGLLCLRHAKSGGLSKITSGIQIYNEMLKRRPELVEALSIDIYRDRRGEIPEGMERTWKVPIFSIVDGYMTVNGGGKYAMSAQRFPEVPNFTQNQQDGIKMYAELCLELQHMQTFNPGDIQFLNNHVIQHSRTEFEDWEDEDKKRHLLRLWLEVPDIRPIHEAFATRINGIVLAGTELKVPLEAE
jgi:hypothetical protein